MGRAKGTNLLHMFTWVEREFGVGTWEKVLHGLSPDEQRRARNILPVRWYDLGLQHRILRAIDRELGRGDGGLVDVIGRYEADQDLSVIHRVFMRMASPSYILERSRDYWERFYDTGAWHVERLGGNHTRGELRGVEPFDPFFARYLHAYIHRMFELTGAKDLQTRYEVRDEAMIMHGEWS